MIKNESDVAIFLGKKAQDVLREAREKNLLEKSLVCKVSYPEEGNTHSYPSLFKVNRDLGLATSPKPKVGAISVICKDNDKEILRSRKAFLITRGNIHNNFVLILSDRVSDPILLVNLKIIKVAEKKAIDSFWVLMRRELISESDTIRNVIQFTSHVVITFS